MCEGCWAPRPYDLRLWAGFCCLGFCITVAAAPRGFRCAPEGLPQMAATADGLALNWVAVKAREFSYHNGICRVYRL